MHWEKSGAFTGEISATMLRALYVKYVVLGHSERRTLFGETDEIVNRRCERHWMPGFAPFFVSVRRFTNGIAIRWSRFWRGRCAADLEGVSQKDFNEIVMAYEPCWAIGTGRTATPAQAEQTHAFIRSVLSELADGATADRVRIQYGGSVKPDNAEELMRQKNIDGALVGGASLDPRSFAQIIRCAEAALASGQGYMAQARLFCACSCSAWTRNAGRARSCVTLPRHARSDIMFAAELWATGFGFRVGSASRWSPLYRRRDCPKAL